MTWQQANIQAAAAYLRERIVGGATDPKTLAVYEGLIEVLDPSRRATRLQRESAAGVKAAAAIQAERVHRAQMDRRKPRDRRRARLGPPAGVERRGATERRSGRDRRSGR